MTNEKKGLKVVVDTSSIDEVRARITKETMSRAGKLKTKFVTKYNTDGGTRKGMNAILSRAMNRGKVAAVKAEKLAEEAKIKREARKNKDKK